MKQAEILEKLENELQRYRGSSRVNYPWVAREFLASIGDKESFDELDAIKFIDEVEKKKAKTSTLKMYFYGLKFLFRSLGIPWTLREPQVFADPERKRRAAKVSRPYFPKEEVMELIQRAKERCNEQQLAFLAGSTVYGCRRSELADIRPEDFNWERKALTIYARKGSNVATHLIPDEIIPYLKAYSWEPLGETENAKSLTASKIFHQILTRIGFGSRNGLGWHSIRRALITELENAGVPAIEIHRFMRWAEPGILHVYIHREFGEVEQSVFPAYPFIPVWR